MNENLTTKQRDWIIREFLKAWDIGRVKAYYYLKDQLTLWKWKEYEHWLGEWNGDEPAPQEHITFEDWLQEASDE